MNSVHTLNYVQSSEEEEQLQSGEACQLPLKKLLKLTCLKWDEVKTCTSKLDFNENTKSVV